MLDNLVQFIHDVIPTKYSALAVGLAGLVAGIGGIFAAKSKTKVDDKIVEGLDKLSKKEPKK